jgi:SMC interacting uncharacterized protein involved in chromosome segregation
MATAPKPTEQTSVTSLSALEVQIESEQKELSRLEEALREADAKHSEMTSQYKAQLDHLTSGEQADVDVADLKEKTSILSDSIRQMQVDCEAKRQELNALCEQLSVLQAQGAKKKDRATTVSS